MPKRCVDAAVRQAMREVLSSRDRLRVIMRATQIIDAADNPLAREAWARELPEILEV